MKGKLVRIALTLAAAIALTGVSPVLAADAVVRIDPAAASVALNQTVAVNVQIDNVTGLFGDEFEISYNAALLEVQDADPAKAGVQIALGSFLKPDFVAKNEVDTAAGKIRFSVTQVSPSVAVSGSGVLATITFKGKADGTSAITFNTANLSTSGGLAIARTLQNGTVAVGSGGPIPGPLTPTPTPIMPGPLPTPSGNILGYHYVRYGETLMCIGRAYGVSPWAIASHNGLVYPYTLRVGQRLAIPNVPWKATYGPVCVRQFGPGPHPTPIPPGPLCRVRYTVHRGDTLYMIAWRYRTTVWTIVSDNGLANPNLIFPGQVLCIR